MTNTLNQIEPLNVANLLTAHRVTPSIDPTLIQASLDLTRILFPFEPTAPDTLGEAYKALTSGQSRYAVFDLLEYFIYTLGAQPQNPVVAASGLYRFFEVPGKSESFLDSLRNTPPPSVAFLRNQEHGMSDFVWGGRLCIERNSARSPSRMPFIIHHILTTAQRIINAQHLAPVLLAFTMRDDNDRVKRFYTQLGFEKTEASLEYGGRVQDVFVLNISPDAPIHSRLAGLMAASRR